MFNRTPWLACLVVMAAASVATAQEMMAFPRGPIDVQSLRAQVLGNLFAEAPEELLPESAEEPLPDNVEWWGIELAEIPEVLYLHCRQLKDGRGLLIGDVLEESPAAQAGLRPGHVLLEVDDRVLYEPADLPAPRAGSKIVLLHEGEVYQTGIPAAEATRDAAPAPQADAPAAAPQERAPAAAPQERAPAAAADPAVPEDRRPASKALVAVPAATQAISMAYANGRYAIEAMMPVQRGYKKVRLEGNRKQIEKQLRDVPEPLRRAIESRLPQTNLQ